MKYKYTVVYPYLIEERNKYNNKDYYPLIDYLTYKRGDLSKIPKELFTSKITNSYYYKYPW